MMSRRMALWTCVLLYACCAWVCSSHAGSRGRGRMTFNGAALGCNRMHANTLCDNAPLRQEHRRRKCTRVCSVVLRVHLCVGASLTFGELHIHVVHLSHG